tara:strand:+ start:21610 stop:22473 length:864 start_codon:yes stop_codon:yes gene_type:complete
MAWTTNKNENKAITTDEKTKGTFALGREAYLAKRKAAQDRNKNFLCCGIWGAPKTAKSALAADILTEEDLANGMHVFVWDYDNRFIDVKRNHYDNIENLVVFNPIERHPDTLVDIKATKHNAEMHYEEAMSFLEQGKLKAVIVDGADKFLTDVCETYMRIKHNLDADTVIKQLPFVWGDRNTPYKNFLHKKILEMECHRIVIAHSKEKYVDGSPVGIVANWHDSTEDIFTSTVRMERKIGKNDTVFTALIEASAVKPELIGTRHTVLTIKNGAVNWTGLPVLMEGEL